MAQAAVAQAAVAQEALVKLKWFSIAKTEYSWRDLKFKRGLGPLLLPPMGDHRYMHANVAILFI